MVRTLTTTRFSCLRLCRPRRARALPRYGRTTGIGRRAPPRKCAWPHLRPATIPGRPNLFRPLSERLAFTSRTFLTYAPAITPPFEVHGAVDSLKALLELGSWFIDLTEEGERVVVAEIETFLAKDQLTLAGIRSWSSRQRNVHAAVAESPNTNTASRGNRGSRGGDVGDRGYEGGGGGGGGGGEGGGGVRCCSESGVQDALARLQAHLEQLEQSEQIQLAIRHKQQNRHQDENKRQRQDPRQDEHPHKRQRQHPHPHPHHHPCPPHFLAHASQFSHAEGPGHPSELRKHDLYRYKVSH